MIWWPIDIPVSEDCLNKSIVSPQIFAADPTDIRNRAEKNEKILGYIVVP